VADQISTITGKKFDPTDIRISQESLDKFVYMCFPSTHAGLTSLGITNIRYYPSFFEIERDSMGKPVCWEGTDSPKICKPDIFEPGKPFEDNVNTVKNSEFWFFKELDLLQELAESS
jgi:hypothetical protein